MERQIGLFCPISIERAPRTKPPADFAAPGPRHRGGGRWRVHWSAPAPGSDAASGAEFDIGVTMQGSTRTRPLNWFVRGGTLTTPDGKTQAIDIDPIVVGREAGASLVLEDPEVSAVH